MRTVLPSFLLACAIVTLTVAPAPARAEAGPAVVVIRDNVTPFQKWGSKTFTELYLGRYSEAVYLTEEDEDGPAGKRPQLAAALRELASRHQAVDLFLLAHGNRYVRVVEQLDPGTRSRLRLVYNTGGGDAEQGGRWIVLGARAYVAHPGGNVAPLFYAFFLRAWTSGVPLAEAVGSSNEETRKLLLEGPSGLVAGAAAEHAGSSAAELWRGTEALLFGDRAVAFEAHPLP